eukprot:514395-Rhodomonas_salina.1
MSTSISGTRLMQSGQQTTWETLSSQKIRSPSWDFCVRRSLFKGSPVIRMATNLLRGAMAGTATLSTYCGSTICQLS